MTNEELKYNITEIVPTATYDESGEFLNVIIPSDELIPLMKELRFRKEFDFLKSFSPLPFPIHKKLSPFVLIYTGKPEETTKEMIEKDPVFNKKKGKYLSVVSFAKTGFFSARAKAISSADFLSRIF